MRGPPPPTRLESQRLKSPRQSNALSQIFPKVEHVCRFAAQPMFQMNLEYLLKTA
jgi:hypothetical protein